MRLLIPVSVSWGELFDILSILGMKSSRVLKNAKFKNIRNELQLFTDIVRQAEQQKISGTRFIEPARALYKTNDTHAALEFQINKLLGSELIGEKSCPGC